MRRLFTAPRCEQDDSELALRELRDKHLYARMEHEAVAARLQQLQQKLSLQASSLPTRRPSISAASRLHLGCISPPGARLPPDGPVGDGVRPWRGRATLSI